MSDNGAADEGEFEIVEIVTEGEDEDGDVMVDDLIVAVDGDGEIIASDETITIATAEGDIVVDEVISVVGDDGELHAIEEDITVVEAPED